jgi:hypothetical protein
LGIRCWTLDQQTDCIRAKSQNLSASQTRCQNRAGARHPGGAKKFPPEIPGETLGLQPFQTPKRRTKKEREFLSTIPLQKTGREQPFFHENPGARVVEAEAQVPMGMAAAFRSGSLGLLN